LALLIARPLTGFAICPAIRGIIAEIKVDGVVRVRMHVCSASARHVQLRGFALREPFCNLIIICLCICGGRARTAVTGRAPNSLLLFLLRSRFLFAGALYDVLRHACQMGGKLARRLLFYLIGRRFRNKNGMLKRAPILFVLLKIMPKLKYTGIFKKKNNEGVAFIPTLKYTQIVLNLNSTNTCFKTNFLFAMGERYLTTILNFTFKQNRLLQFVLCFFIAFKISFKEMSDNIEFLNIRDVQLY